MRDFMQFARRLVLLLAGSLALAPHGHAQNSGATLQTEEKIEILVNDTPISGYDISQRVRLMSVTTRQQPTPAMRKKAVEDLISESIQIQDNQGKACAGAYRLGRGYQDHEKTL
jgi:hypothetical protein